MQKELSIHSLGLCEHCHGLVTTDDYPPESINESWKCPNPACGKPLSPLSFGHPTKDSTNRTKYVGPLMNWVNSCPESEFLLNGGQIHVTLEQGDRNDWQVSPNQRKAA